MVRRGVGIASVQQKKQTEQNMASLGAQLHAERVSQIADQLSQLEVKLKELASKYKEQIVRDPVLRARFRQFADTLGVDLLSSSTNVFSKSLGFGDYYYDLGGRIVEICMKERQFAGALVPRG